MINLTNAKAGMGQLVRQRAVVRHKQQPLAVLIEPADGKQPLASPWKEVDHARASAGVAVGAEKTNRLIEQKPGLALESHAFSVEPHLLVARGDAKSQLGDRAAVDGHAAGENELFAVAARAGARHCQIALQANPLAGGFEGPLPAWHGDIPASPRGCRLRFISARDS